MTTFDVYSAADNVIDAMPHQWTGQHAAINEFFIVLVRALKAAYAAGVADERADERAKLRAALDEIPFLTPEAAVQLEWLARQLQDRTERT